MSHYVNIVNASFFKYTAVVECNKARHYEGVVSVVIVSAIWKIQNITWHPHRQHTRFKRTYTVSIYTRAYWRGESSVPAYDYSLQRCIIAAAY